MNYSLDENYILRACVFLEDLCNRESSSTRLTIFMIRRFEFRVTSTKCGSFVFICNIVLFSTRNYSSKKISENLCIPYSLNPFTTTSCDTRENLTSDTQIFRISAKIWSDRYGRIIEESDKYYRNK